MLLTIGRGLAPVRSVVKKTNPTMLADIVPACLFDLDATLAQSYGGDGAIWTNLTKTPADGSASAAYNFFLGTSGTVNAASPVFVGGAGHHGAYFEFDGVDDTLTLAGSNTPYLDNLPKTTGGSLPVTMVLAFKSVIETVGRVYMGSFQGSFPCVRVQYLSAQQIRLQQGSGSAFSQSTGVSMAAGRDCVVIMTLGADGTWQTWVNGQKTFGQMTLTPTTNNAGTFRIMSSAGNGLRLYAAGLCSTLINDAQAAQILTLYRGRHNRDYAGS